MDKLNGIKANYNNSLRKVIGSTSNPQSKDVDAEYKVSDGLDNAADENKDAGKRSKVTNLTQDVDVAKKLNSADYKSSDNVVDNDILRLSQDKASGVIDYSSNKTQLAIYNPTTTVIKLGVDRVDANSYMFTVKANQMVILPPMNFSKIYYLQETIQTGIYVTPIVYAYAKPCMNAGIYTI